MRNNVISWILKRIRKRIPTIVLVVVLCIVNALLGVSFALGSRGVIDGAISGDKQTFLRACMVQLAIILGILTTLTINRHLKERLIMDLERDWKRQLLGGLLHGDYSGVSQYHSGELLNRLNNDVRILNTGIINIVPSLSSMTTRLISAVAVLIAIEPMFTLVVLAAGLAVILLTSIVRKNLKNMNKRVSEAEGRVSGFIQETLEKLLMVQAMDVSAEMEKRAEVHMEDRYQIQRKRKNISLLANTFISVLGYGAGFGALVFCGGGLLAGTMTFGTLTAVTQLVSQLQGPLVNMSGIIPQYVALVAAGERLQELEELYKEPEPEKLEAAPIYDSMNALRGEHLHFAYDRDCIFEDAEFTVEKGSFGAILGHSGIGKSTLLKLLMGIYKPASGQLYVETEKGQIPIDRSTRRLFAYVPQGNLLLSGTIRENLTITRPEASDEEIEQAVHISCMDDYIYSFPKGLDTPMGESGAGLSEGQAQRLSIARAVLSGAPILLLDEATSALDGETEKIVLERLRSLKNRTCIAVTHRPAALALCDWTMEMKDGKCVITKTE